MNTEKKQQARNLFFQTELTKTQIAGMLNISRRSLTYWIQEGNWNRMKNAAAHLPSILAENCYHIVGHLTEHYLSERRLTNPVSHKEADTLHKLVCTINKLKNRSALNENMEMFGFFLDGLKQKDPRLAADLAPHIDEYLSARADIYISDVQPQNFTTMGRIPWPEENDIERQVDNREAFYSDPDTIEAYAAAGMEMPDEETINTIPPSEPNVTHRRANFDLHNTERLARRQRAGIDTQGFADPSNTDNDNLDNDTAEPNNKPETTDNPHDHVETQYFASLDNRDR